VSVARVMPVQKPGKSVQEVGTPPEFLDAVERRFGEIAWDLAANGENHVVPGWCGPGSEYQPDSLLCDWAGHRPGLLWLNPPYGEIGKWAAKCAEQSAAGACRIAFLVPASVGTNWFAAHVDRKALVLFLSPRLTFVGHTQSYPKDLMLAVYGEPPGYECWRWKP